ncbi:MAG: PAS domain S-box protein, partial [Calditrichota bacterium]
SDKAPVGADYYKLVHPKDVAYLRSQLALCLREGQTSFVHRVYINEELNYLECHLWREEDENACIKGICRDVTSQKFLEEENRNLKKSEELWKAALENAEQGVWDWDVEHSTVFFSDMWKRMLGFEPDEISNSFEEWEQRVHPDDLAGAYENIQAHIEGRSELYSYEQRLLRKDGKYMWILGSGKVVERKADGSPKRFIGTHTDINHLKQVEANAKRLALVAEKTQNSVIVTGVDGNITWVNNSFERLTGYEAKEVIGRTPGSFLQGKDTDPDVIQAMKKSIAECKPFDGEIYNYHKDGTGYWLSISITPIFRDEKHVGFIAIQSDIDERKAIEQQLRRSESRLRRAQETAKIGHWYYDVKTQQLEWSDVTSKIHGVDPGYKPVVESAINFYHPDSREVILAAFTAALEEGKSYDLDLQIVNIQGETVDVRAIGRAVFKETEIIAVSGIFQDISRNKQYERDLVTVKEKAEAGSRAK